MRTMKSYALAALVLGLVTQFACEQQDDGGFRTTGARPSGELGWLVKAAEGNLAEIDAGRMAQTRAGSVDVKEFGQQMVVDHSKANIELTELAMKKGFSLPTRTDEDHRRAAAELGKLNGPEFDRKFAETMVTDHEKAVSLFESNREAKDADVKAFVDKTLPTLKHHLEMARDLKGKVGAEKAD